MGDNTLTDPLGRKITLLDRAWYAHIVKGHPEISEHRALVEAAVTSPREIRISRSDPDCRLYFGHGPREGVIMMVVADLPLGIVKTAHLCKRVSGGRQEWSK